MKLVFLACTVEENGKFYSFVEVVRVGEELKHLIDRHENLVIAHLCGSRHEADDLVVCWNEQYRANGTYMF